MNTLLALLLSTGMVTSDELDIGTDCQKYDGQQPNRCELALANELFNYQRALEGCHFVNVELKKENEELKELVLTPPPKEEKSPISLFGMPGWVTPVLAGVLIGAGFGVGLAL